MAKGKRKAPSRIRYEQSHPTISCRVPRETYDRLQDIKLKEKRSFADILKIGLGMLELRAEEKDEAYSRGHDDGYLEAELEFKVTFPCSVCGKTIALRSKEAKQAASKYMQEHSWGHSECHEKRREGYL